MDYSELLQLHKSKTVRNTALVFTGKVFVAIISAIITIILARTLGPEEFGILSFFGATSLLMTNLSGFGINTTLVRYFPFYYKKDRKFSNLILKTSLKIKVILAFAISILGFIFSKQIALIIFNNDQLILPLRFAFISIIGSTILSFVYSVFQAKQQFKKSVFLSFITTSLKLMLLLLLILIYKLNIFNVLTVFIVVPIMGIILGSLIGNFSFLKSKGNEKKALKKILKFSKWIIVIIICYSIYIKLDVLMLAYFNKISEIGYYSAANSIASKLTLILGSIIFVLFPKISSFSSKKEIKIFFKKYTLIILPIILMLSPAILISKPLILLIYGQNFSNSIPLFQILYIRFLIALFVNPFYLIFYAINKAKIFALISFINLIFVFIMNLVLIPVYGALGASVTILLATIIGGTTSIAYFYHNFNKRTT